MMARTGRWLSLLLALLLACPPALAATPRNALIEVTRNPVFNADTLLSDYREARAILSKVQGRLSEARQERRQAPLDRVEVAMLVAQMALTNVDILMSARKYPEASADLDIAIHKIREAQLLLMPSRTVEGRGMILDSGSIPHTREAIADLMQKLADANFNFVIPEVFLRGYTVYPSRLAEQDPDFRAVPFDVMQAVVEEAHRHGLEVHPWIWTFRVRSPAAGSAYGNPVLDKLPAVAALTSLPTPSPSPSPTPSPSPGASAVPLRPSGGMGVENNYVSSVTQFMSPAAPESRRFIMLLVDEMVQKYQLDGILLDYIRYDETIANDFVSQTAFRLDFYEKHGAWPPDPLEPGAPEYAEWQVWRELQVGAMVALVSKEVKRLRPGMTVSAAVFRSEVYARLTKMQNWRHWADNGWLDAVGPMLYTSDPGDLDTWLDWETNNGTRNDVIYPILGAIRFRYMEDLYAQIDILQQRNIPGLSIFSLTHVNRLSQTVFTDLKVGPFRESAYAPHRGLVRAAAREAGDLAAWLRDIARERVVQDNDLLNVGVALQKLSVSLPKGNTPLQDPGAYIRYLGELQDQVVNRFRARGLPTVALNLLHQRWQYLLELFRIYQTDKGRGRNYVPPEPPPTNVMPETRLPPNAGIHLTASPPELDGHLDEWPASLDVDHFYWQTGASRAQAATTVRLTRDSRNLYIAFANSEPNMSRVKSLDTVRNSGKLFASDDVVEVFIQPPVGSAYYHFAVNAGNTQFSQKVENGVYKKFDRRWSSAVYQRTDGWDVEIAIPWSVLETSAPYPGERWHANFCRDRQQEVNPFSCWSATYGSYHTPKRFGSLSVL